jgi:hypothetical protein
MRICEQDLPAALSYPFRQVLLHLMQGVRYAEETGRSVWDYAVEIQDLKELGLTSNDLRWMICQDWVEHACEVSGLGESARGFQQEHPLSFSPGSCFVLKGPGVAMASHLATDERTSANDPHATDPARESAAAGKAARGTTARPHWDADRNRLYVGGVLVKEFKLPCPNQGTILMAFEEEKWPARIDDPLPPNGETDARTRLSSTSKSLNKYQKNRLIHFMGDGTGEGVMWEFVGRL